MDWQKLSHLMMELTEELIERLFEFGLEFEVEIEFGFLQLLGPERWLFLIGIELNLRLPM